ncbi:MAG: hypothetical protein AAF632_21205 [Bacteroidota bacterium]
MIIEIICIITQAARGIQSHFNFSTQLNASIFALMGNAIAINTLLAVWLTILFL